jgi:hypothetical protein
VTLLQKSAAAVIGAEFFKGLPRDSRANRDSAHARSVPEWHGGAPQGFWSTERIGDPRATGCLGKTSRAFRSRFKSRTELPFQIGPRHHDAACRRG